MMMKSKKKIKGLISSLLGAMRMRVPAKYNSCYGVHRKVAVN